MSSPNARAAPDEIKRKVDEYPLLKAENERLNEQVKRLAAVKTSEMINGILGCAKHEDDLASLRATLKRAELELDFIDAQKLTARNLDPLLEKIRAALKVTK